MEEKAGACSYAGREHVAKIVRDFVHYASGYIAEPLINKSLCLDKLQKRSVIKLKSLNYFLAHGVVRCQAEKDEILPGAVKDVVV
jgi:hypothetical protein